MTERLKATYIDTCFVDYLTDHYNRDNQYLAHASADISCYDRIEDVVKELVDNVECYGWEVVDGFSEVVIQKAITVALQDYNLEDITVAEPEEDEECANIWVLLEVIEGEEENLCQ